MISKPTKEQIKEFWGRVNSFIECQYAIDNSLAVYITKPEFKFVGYGVESITLDNLFKYAVLKTIAELIISLGTDEVGAVSFLFARWQEYFNKGYSFKDALFWAIWEVIKGE